MYKRGTPSDGPDASAAKHLALKLPGDSHIVCARLPTGGQGMRNAWRSSDQPASHQSMNNSMQQPKLTRHCGARQEARACTKADAGHTHQMLQQQSNLPTTPAQQPHCVRQAA